jgi:acyl-CoA synthetase (AMP-forming)/AMP-acid ligase II/thioesterase domain-containing protein/acyl carrier protein
MSPAVDTNAPTIAGVLHHWEEATPDAPALLAPGREPLTYGRLAQQVRETAEQLRSLGVDRYDRIALVYPNGPELAAGFLGIASAAVCAPLNHTYRAAEFDFYLSDLDAKAVVLPAGVDSPLRLLAERRGIRLLEVIPTGSGEAGACTLSEGKRATVKPAASDDAALVLHTSGTTARAKVVPLKHRQLVLSARNVAHTLELVPSDRCLNVMPLFHVHALVGALLASLSAGASVVCSPGFHAPSFHGWVAELEPTWYTAVPTMHRAILDRAGDATRPCQSLRFVRSSSAPLPARVYDELEATFRVPVIEAYGMTEAAHQVTSNRLPPAMRKRGSVGRPSHVDVTVLDEQGRALPPGKTGEVAIRGETVFAGYEANPEANEAAFVDGWFRTGDEGILDQDGYLFLRGRIKEIINRAGEKVSPGEVEDALLAHPDVVQAVSFAVPHRRLGEDVGAAVVLRKGARATQRDLQERVAAEIAEFKIPSTIAIVEEIPRGPTGKIQRVGLAERLGIGEMAGSSDSVAYVAPRTQLEREVAALWASTLAVERVGVHDDFFALGGDSILGAELIAALAEHYGQTVPLTTLMWAPTLAEFTALLEDGTWDDDSPIVPVRTGGSLPPLFVTHGLGDEVLNIGVLKRTLAEEQPLYAVRIVPHHFFYGSVEEIARDYLDEIQALQPEGPYYFASICSGGAIVAELVRHARASGEEVALAAVIDPLRDLGQGFVRHYAARMAEHGRAGTFGFAVRRKLRHWLARAMPARYPDPELEVDPLGRVIDSLRRRYRLKHIPGTLTVISTMDYDTPRSFWEQRADHVEWYEVDAPHATIFQHPHADVIGEVLDEVLRDVHAEAGR